MNKLESAEREKWINALILGFISFLFFLVWGLFTISKSQKYAYYGAYLGTIVFFAAYVLFFFRCIHEREEVRIQFLVVHCLLFIVDFLLIIYCIKNKYIWLSFILFVALIVIILMGWLVRDHFFFSLKKKRSVDWKIVFLIIIVCILSIEYTGMQFKWDGLLYHEACQKSTIFSLSSLTLYGHLSFSYAGLITLVNGIIQNLSLTMNVLNITLLCMASLSFYSILCHIMKNQNSIFCIIGTAIYALAPSCVGMVNYHSLDFYLQCFFPVLFLFFLKEKWVYFYIIGMIFCFTKEPAVIIYCAMVLGIWIVELMKESNSNLQQKIKSMLTKRKFYLLVISLIIWFLFYCYLGPWTAGESEWGISSTFVLNKLKVLYLFNFNWIFTIFSIIFLICMILKKKVYRNNWIVVLTLVQIAFTGFSCLLKTANHPRYSDISYFSIALTTVVCICQFKKRYASVLLTLLVIIQVSAVYKTWDPISKSLFLNIDIGNDIMLSTSGYATGDSMVYNKQMLYMEDAFNQAIAKYYSDSTMICVPAINDSTYYFDGMAEVRDVNGIFYLQQEYWDEMNKKRVVKNGSSNLQICQISQNCEIEYLNKLGKKKIVYIYMEKMGDSFAKRLENKFPNYRLEEIKYKDWKINCLSVIVEDKMGVKK